MTPLRWHRCSVVIPNVGALLGGFAACPVVGCRCAVGHDPRRPFAEAAVGDNDPLGAVLEERDPSTRPRPPSAASLPARARTGRSCRAGTSCRRCACRAAAVALRCSRNRCPDTRFGRRPAPVPPARPTRNRSAASPSPQPANTDCPQTTQQPAHHRQGCYPTAPPPAARRSTTPPRPGPAHAAPKPPSA